MKAMGKLDLGNARLIRLATLLVALFVTFNTRAETVDYEQSSILGWTIKVHPGLLENQPKETRLAIALLKRQLEEVSRVVPKAALKDLHQVKLYLSPEYPGVRPRAEYHPGKKWLVDHGRDPEMVRSIEFSNIRIFEAETRRMPNFALHELAHAYHHQFLPKGYQNERIRSAFRRAAASGKYDQVRRRDSDGRVTQDRAYAITNPQEYFAETTEAYFSRNDFFPFDRRQLQTHDPFGARMIEDLWSNSRSGSRPIQSESNTRDDDNA